jgi:mannose-6-phosphate isomerase
MLYPLRFTPRYYEKVWGGRRLASLLGRELPPHSPIGESWEVADHPHGESIIVNGVERGKSLQQLIAQYGATLLGTRVVAVGNATSFPLLVKYIDADDKLSVQVHPDDAYAATHAGERGKTEMWYVLHADAGATLIVGLQHGVTAAQFAQALQSGDPATLLHQMPVKTGDSIFIPAGRIHAIMPGLVILEIQQNSDTTYRLYDWGRLGLDGKPRELHVQDALAVANWTDYTPASHTETTTLDDGNTKTLLACCEYFVVEKFDLTQTRTFVSGGESFHILNCVAGSGTLTWAGGEETLQYGDTLLIPAEITAYTVAPRGAAAVVISSVP